MKRGTQEGLDAEELLHLAVLDSQQGRHDEAIKKLKSSLEANPDNAKAHYMLAAEHAEIGLFDRAIEEMTKAVELDPSLATAHFQLGLLYYSANRVDEARQSWSALDQLDGVGSLIAFKTALLYLVDNRLEDCLAELSRGIEGNKSNPALTKDMIKVRDNVQRLLRERASPATSTTTSKHVLLSTYRDQSEESEN